ncbi:lanthionine synthetase LanC family protein [Lactococcus allomyrinae]|uniref:lanthionine synthetase LanC family protein n=1 Tax=Lactococcus allomyrinae TaxID=2419773 RepID=UPI001F0936B8|nr:lanthionine synthetase LanC family protein [Lactococcus allomyrinae]
MKIINENKVGNIGLNGLTGYLWNLSLMGYSEIIDEKIEYLLTKLNGSFLHLTGKNYSPYVLNGSSGLALFLMNYNFKKYETQIISISNGMNVKFAKSMDFEKGLLGISYFLLEVYKKTGDKKYLNWVDEQLQTCQVFVKNKKLYNFYTKNYEEDFLKGYKGYLFVKEMRERL